MASPTLNVQFSLAVDCAAATAAAAAASSLQLCRRLTGSPPVTRRILSSFYRNPSFFKLKFSLALAVPPLIIG